MSKEKQKFPILKIAFFLCLALLLFSVFAFLRCFLFTGDSIGKFFLSAVVLVPALFIIIYKSIATFIPQLQNIVGRCYSTKKRLLFAILLILVLSAVPLICLSCTRTVVITCSPLKGIVIEKKTSNGYEYLGSTNDGPLHVRLWMGVRTIRATSADGRQGTHQFNVEGFLYNRRAKIVSIKITPSVIQQSVPLPQLDSDLVRLLRHYGLSREAHDTRKPDEIRDRILHAQRAVENNNLDLAEDILTQAQTLMGSTTQDRKNGDIHVCLAYVRILLGKFTHARNHINIATGIFRSLNDIEGIASAFFAEGFLEEAQAKPEAAVASYHDATRHFKELLRLDEIAKDITAVRVLSRHIAACLIRKSTMHKHLHQYEKALLLLEEAKGYSNLILGEDRDVFLAGVFNNIGSVYFSAHKYKEARSAYRSSLDLSKKTKNLPGIAATELNLGIVSELLRDPETAQRFFQNAYLAATTKGGDRWVAAKASYHLGLTQMRDGHEDLGAENLRRACEIMLSLRPTK